MWSGLRFGDEVRRGVEVSTPRLLHTSRADDGAHRELPPGFLNIALERGRVVAKAAGIVDEANQRIHVVLGCVSRSVLRELADYTARGATSPRVIFTSTIKRASGK